MDEIIYISDKEAAEQLNIKYLTIRHLCRKGILNYKIIGMKWLIIIDEKYITLKNFINGTANNDKI